MKLRFQADADLNEHIVKGILRRYPLIDFKAANASALRGLRDLEVLALVADENRVLVSHDRKSMPRAFATFTARRSNPGLILISQRTDVLVAIEWLNLAWAATEAAEWEGRILTLPL